jgi:serine O-acetyltransferase
MTAAESQPKLSGSRDKLLQDSAIAAAFSAPTPSSEALVAAPDAGRLGESNLNPAGIGFWALVGEDLRTHESDPFSQGFWALAVHRFGNARMSIRPKLLRAPFSILYKILYKLVEWTCGISLDYATRVGRRVHLWHHGGMILSCRSIGDDVHIRQNTTFGVRRRNDDVSQRQTIEARCDIGVGAVILGAITIGHDSQIGANAVVLKDVPPNSVAVGVPAKVIKSRDEGSSS